MSRKEILKIFLFIIFILLIVFSIYIIRNYIILNKIYRNELKLSKYTNYSFVQENYTDKTTRREIYYKDGKNILVTKIDNANIITWSDEETKETITVWPNTLKANIREDKIVTRNHIPVLVNEYNIFSLSLISHISSDSINGEECYVIKWDRAITYISKENGTILKDINGKQIIEGKEYDNIIEYKNWKFNELTDEEMSKPDLTEYEVSDAATGYDYQY